MAEDFTPLTGRCMCGGVEVRTSEPFLGALYCHCKRCQRRSGTTSTVNAVVAADGFAVVEGAEHVRTWLPPDGKAKSFCSICGGHLYSSERDGSGPFGVRLGALDGDPGIPPQWRQWLESAPAWEPVPDDGLPRFRRSRFDG